MMLFNNFFPSFQNKNLNNNKIIKTKGKESLAEKKNRRVNGAKYWT